MMMTESSYGHFLQTKMTYAASAGLPVRTLPARLFPFQRQVTRWAIERGRAAIWLDTGLGKTACQLTWAQHVAEQAGDVLILAPLAVSQQTVREGVTMGIGVTLCRTRNDVRPGINITNYERLHHFDATRFAGVVCDESSILKSYDAKTRTQLIETFRHTPYKLCCTATPSPNDYMELGNHAEMLSVMSRNEMLATYFTHDGGNTSQWRLKKHAEPLFWRWVASWAFALTHPRLIGDTTPGYDLPPLNRHLHPVAIDTAHTGLMLFPMEVTGLNEQRTAKRAGLDARVRAAVETIHREPDEPWLVWAELNDEADAITNALPGAVQIAGRDSVEEKEKRLLRFCSGETHILVSKASICGFGLNLQHCARICFVGINNSFESWYQSVRRCWRFGQTRPVDVHIFYLQIESPILRNLSRKEAEASRMHHLMTQAILEHHQWQVPVQPYEPKGEMVLPAWLTANVERTEYAERD
jgi:hypothetical protein